MKDRFVNKAEFAKFPNKFDVSQHLDLCNSTLLLLVCGKWAVLFVKDYGEQWEYSVQDTPMHTVNQSHDR